MKIEDLLKEPNQELALTKAIAMITIMDMALNNIDYNPHNPAWLKHELREIARDAKREVEELK